MKKTTFTLLALWMAVTSFAQDGTFHLDKEYTINKTGTIDLGSSDAKVFIMGTNRSTAHIKIDRKVTSKGLVWGEREFHVDVDEHGGDLKIREKESNTTVSMIGYYHEDYRIEIEAPEGVNLMVRGDDGDYYIKNINGSITMSLDDADAELADCKGYKFKFKLDDGDIRMNQGQGSIEIIGDDADVDIHHGQFTSIHADVDDGELMIETSLADKGKYYLESEDGLIALNITAGGGEFDIAHEDGRIITEGNFKVREESEKEKKLTLASGTATVTLRADDARIKLSAR